MSVVNRNGSRSWGSGSALGQPVDLLGLERHAAAGTAAAAGRSASPGRSDAGRLGGGHGVGVQPGDVGVHAVDDHRPEPTPTRSSRL